MAEDIGWDVTATRLTRRPAHGRPLALDVRDAAAVEHAFAESAPDAVVHCAYVHLGPAATETTVRGSRNVARAAQHVGARLVHMSTDLVFDGEPTRAYTEEDQPRPISEYGAAKAEAERQVAHACPQAVLVRTGLIYGGPIPGQHERLVLDALDDAADVQQAAIELAVVPGEDPQAGDLGREASCACGVVLTRDAEQHQQAEPDPASNGTVDFDLGSSHTLTDRPHLGSLPERNHASSSTHARPRATLCPGVPG